MRKKFLESTGRHNWQALEDILQIVGGIMSVKLRRLYQAHDGSGAQTGA
jgi:hypothetical protein